MLKQFYNVIGVMSGTSLDGVDLAHIYFTKVNNRWDFKILETETVAYTTEWFNKLKNAVQFSDFQLKQLNLDYTALLAEIMNNFIEANKNAHSR